MSLGRERAASAVPQHCGWVSGPSQEYCATPAQEPRKPHEILYPCQSHLWLSSDRGTQLFSTLHCTTFIILFISKLYSKSVLGLYHNSFRLPFIKMMSVCWLITLTGPSGKSLTQQGMRPWCPLYVSLCLHPTKKLLIWRRGEMQIKLFSLEFRWLLLIV